MTRASLFRFEYSRMIVELGVCRVYDYKSLTLLDSDNP
jgi:hypothetical protein